MSGNFCSIASLDGMLERTVTVNGLSKAFAMTGWRLGYIGAPLSIAKACSKIQGQCTSGTNAVAQRAAIVALNADPTVIAPMREKFTERRELVIDALDKIDDLSCEEPDGAFYVMPDVSAYYGKHFKGKSIESASDLSTLLLEEALVAVVSGEGFGAPDRIRISYATSNELLSEALARMTKFLNELQ
jgi:aspartate aminotransferase